MIATCRDTAALLTRMSSPPNCSRRDAHHRLAVGLARDVALDDARPPAEFGDVVHRGRGALGDLVDYDDRGALASE